MNNKITLAIVVLLAISVSGCISSYEEREDFCKSHGFYGHGVDTYTFEKADYFCFNEIENDTIEKHCYESHNNKFYFVECDG